VGSNPTPAAQTALSVGRPNGGDGVGKLYGDRPYLTVTVLVADPPRLLFTVTLPGFDGQLNSPR
jgi:hypothetical protein